MDVCDAECFDKIRKPAQDLDGLFDALAHKPPLIKVARESDGVLALEE